jgi:hypothetical protein
MLCRLIALVVLWRDHRILTHTGIRRSSLKSTASEETPETTNVRYGFDRIHRFN